ncbi:MAG: hypothetical protein WCX96_00475 [Bacilli bacterium]
MKRKYKKKIEKARKMAQKNNDNSTKKTRRYNPKGKKRLSPRAKVLLTGGAILVAGALGSIFVPELLPAQYEEDNNIDDDKKTIEDQLNSQHTLTTEQKAFVNSISTAINEIRQTGTDITIEDAIYSKIYLNSEHLTKEQIALLISEKVTVADIEAAFLKLDLEIAKVATVHQLLGNNINSNNFINNEKDRAFISEVRKYIDSIVSSGKSGDKIQKEFKKFIKSIYIEPSNDYAFSTSSSVRLHALTMISVLNNATNQFLGDELSIELFGNIDANLTCEDGKLTVYSQLRNEATSTFSQKMAGIDKSLYNEAIRNKIIHLILVNVYDTGKEVDKNALLQVIRTMFSVAYDKDGKPIGENNVPAVIPLTPKEEEEQTNDLKIGDYETEDGQDLEEAAEDLQKSCQEHYYIGVDDGKTGKDKRDLPDACQAEIYSYNLGYDYGTYLKNQPKPTPAPEPTPTAPEPTPAPEPTTPTPPTVTPPPEDSTVFVPLATNNSPQIIVDEKGQSWLVVGNSIDEFDIYYLQGNKTEQSAQQKIYSI